jgi:hypothetical protein
MSWHLTRNQRNAIETSWSSRAAHERQCVADFLAGRPPCAQPPGR